jgi:hypothetical protein
MTQNRISSVFATWVIGLVAVVASAACAPPANEAGPTTAPSSAPAETPTPSAAQDNSPPPSNSKVTVSTSAGKYGVGAMVTVSITNNLDKVIYTEDFKTACTIAYVQRLNSGAWTDIGACRLERPTIIVSLAPGQVRTVSYDPSSFSSGTYRVRFTYRMTQDGNDPLTAYSSEFKVG